MIRRLIVIFVLSSVFMGCGASKFKTFRLPISANGAPFTFSAIATVARSQGLEVARFDDSVHVRLDDATWAFYTVQLDEYNLVIQVDNELVPLAELAAHFEAARQKADQILKLALAQLPYTI